MIGNVQVGSEEVFNFRRKTVGEKKISTFPNIFHALPARIAHPIVFSTEILRHFDLLGAWLYKVNDRFVLLPKGWGTVFFLLSNIPCISFLVGLQQYDLWVNKTLILMNFALILIYSEIYPADDIEILSTINFSDNIKTLLFYKSES